MTLSLTVLAFTWSLSIQPLFAEHVRVLGTGDTLWAGPWGSCCLGADILAGGGRRCAGRRTHTGEPCVVLGAVQEEGYRTGSGCVWAGAV